MALQFACELLVDVENLGCECDLPVEEAVIEAVLEGASDFLSQLAGMPLGRCTNAYRPCRDNGCTPTLCGCCHLRGIHLPGVDPTVKEVWVDGAIVASSTYVVMVSPLGTRVLERINTEGASISWPYCASILKARTVDGTFEIVVESGQARNQLMTLAAGEIACDIFSFMAGGDHLLPAGVASAVAYNVTMNTRLPFDPTRGQKLDLSTFTWVSRFLDSLPSTSGTEIISPETDDGWTLFQRA